MIDEGKFGEIKMSRYNEPQQLKEQHRCEVGMEEIIGKLIGKKIDVNCGSATVFRGENLGYSNDVLELKDEFGKTVYINGARILALSEVSDAASRPGFIG